MRIKKKNIIEFHLDLNFDKSLNISKYNHTRVTSKPNAPNHSIYFGAPSSDPSSIKSKSRTKLSDAITTTKRLNQC